MKLIVIYLYYSIFFYQMVIMHDRHSSWIFCDAYKLIWNIKIEYHSFRFSKQYKEEFNDKKVVNTFRL